MALPLFFVLFAFPLSAFAHLNHGDSDKKKLKKLKPYTIKQIKKMKSISFYKHVWPIFEVKCVKCHSPHKYKGKMRKPGGKLDLRKELAYKNLVGVQSRQAKKFKIVAPYKPQLSYLVYKLQGNHKHPSVGGKGKRMPPKKSKLKFHKWELFLVVKWIQKGAKK